MSQVQKYILDVPYTKEEIRKLKKKHTIVVAKDVVLIIDSFFWFKRLCQFPKRYKLFHLLPQVKNAPSLFNQYHSLRSEKIEEVKKQNFYLAAKLRERENKLEAKIIDQYNINSFKMSNYYVDKNRTNLSIIWLDRTK